MHKPALLALIILILIAEFKTQQQHGILVEKVLAAEVERSIYYSHAQLQQDYWKKLVTDNPTYRDGYLQLAIIASQLGNKVSSQTWISKIYEVDPNFQLPALLQGR